MTMDCGSPLPAAFLPSGPVPAPDGGVVRSMFPQTGDNIDSEANQNLNQFLQTR